MNKIFKTLALASLTILAILALSCNNDDNTPIAVPNCIPTNLQNGIIVSYTFANGSLNDSSGNGYHLSNSTSASAGADRAGNTNCAFHFTKANGEYLQFLNPTFLDNLNTQPISISLWYKNETVNFDKYEILIGRKTNLVVDFWSIGLFDIGRPTFGNNGYCIWAPFPAPGGFTTSQWRHLVVTSSGTNLQLFVNGVLTTESAGTCYTDVIFNTLNVNGLVFGIDYDGFLDDIVIYNRILSQAEITQLYNLAPCCS